jgi:two-component system, cell cycle sensor histidine kinase PleC
MSGAVVEESCVMSSVPHDQAQRFGAMSSETPLRRKATTREVRAVREKLTSATGLVRADDYELLRSFANQRIEATVAVLMLVISVAAISLTWIPVMFAGSWVSLMLAPILGLHMSCRRFLKIAPEQINLRSWQNVFVIRQAFEGVCWASIPFVLLMADGGEAKLFAMSVLLLAGALTVMLTSSLPRAVYAGLIPIALSIALSVWTRRDADMMTMAGMAFAAQLFFLVIAHRLHTSAVSDISSRAEKDSLIVELETARANSDEARRKAEEANLAKSRFLATMSHELRTPLNAIMGFSEVMKNEVFGSHTHGSYKEYSGDIHSSGQHLLNLINEILDLSRIEAGKYELNEEALNLGHLVDDCRHMLALRATSKSQTIRDMIDPALPRIWADERAVRQIVLNILSNAIKFTPQGGEIIIKAGWTTGGGQYVTIIDTGPGIPEEEIPTVLASFGRGSLAIKTAEQGSGLGLPIVKGLVDLHGGGFTFKSKLRVGTEVTVTFPAARVMDTLAAVQPEDEHRARRRSYAA